MSLSRHLSPVKSSIGVHGVFSCLVSCKGIIYTIVQNLSVPTSSTNPRSILLCGKGRRTLTWECCSALQALKDHFCAVLEDGLLMILLSSKPLVVSPSVQSECLHLCLLWLQFSKPICQVAELLLRFFLIRIFFSARIWWGGLRVSFRFLVLSVHATPLLHQLPDVLLCRFDLACDAMHHLMSLQRPANPKMSCGRVWKLVIEIQH